MNRGAGLLLAAMLAGCGYQTGSMMPGGVTDVAVELFEDTPRPETRYRHVEVAYTRFLTRELARRPHVRIRDPAAAQALIRGRLFRMDRQTLVEDDDDFAIESGMVAAVRVEVLDPQTGLPLMEPFVVTRRGPQRLPLGETVESSLEEAMELLARDTVIRIEAEPFFRERMAAARP